jgi:prepilin-type N-terminal cleavage/methylation domain-containing protein/prepilin-type processing-associated H-X9-DG protein
MKKKSAFTLIELLVVVAIIAILAALLFPSLQAFLEKGKATDCLNNLKSIGNTVTQYMVDQNESFFSTQSTGQDTWPKVLSRKYAGKDWRTFRSPFDKATEARPKNKDEDPIPVSYGMNEALFDTFAGKWKAPRTTLIMAAPALLPSSTGKDIQFKTDAFNTSNVMLTKGQGSGKLMDKGYGTHEQRQKINVLFADGHASPMDIHRYDDGTSEPRGKQQWDPMYEPE